ncbi:hypothetical protein EDD96_4930 [Streptomyces sp. Ag109_G2-6]|uniref:LppU/SCO3897 family protein n=1 Tax=Streptomyces sp. Ag109_G2-6 TaxID=2485154 RepID=UPI000FC04192|nr:hypothetical protein [Streptomyces sp. Ag109_G2-6]RPF41138.1 hypothetical protein EDD96_4930 [Streptomyces sp. Ag109_G2-6]
MSSEEVQLTLTPAQAAAGATVGVPLPSGTVRLRIPPARDGDLVRARIGDEEVLLRIRVPGPAATQPVPPPPPPPTPGPATAPAPTPAPAPAGKSGALGCLLALGVVAALVIGIVVASGSDDDSRPTATASATPSSAYSPYSPYTPPTPTPTYTDTGAPATDPAAAPTFSLPLPGQTSEAPRPFDEGTCLNGQLPDSTTATRVTGVHEVSCGADDAHYRVIQRFPGTSDMSRCDENSDTEYGFSYRYTINGSVINEYVYCLVGLGSYARG